MPSAFVIFFSLAILVLFSISALLIFRNLFGKSPISRWITLTPAVFAILLQIFHLSILIHGSQGQINLGFFNALVLISWLVSVQIIIASLKRPLESLGVLMFPISGLASFLATVLPHQHLIELTSDYLEAHIVLSVIAYSLMTLSALQAIFLYLQDRAIRSHHPGGLVRFLPPLHDMEILLFQMLGFSFIFLSTALLSGFFFIEDLFAQHLVHKTVLSIFSWTILGVLLFGRIRFGWRGKKAIRLTLVAAVLVMLAYFGSKFVLELVLSQ